MGANTSQCAPCVEGFATANVGANSSDLCVVALPTPTKFFDEQNNVIAIAAGGGGGLLLLGALLVFFKRRKSSSTIGHNQMSSMVDMSTLQTPKSQFDADMSVLQIPTKSPTTMTSTEAAILSPPPKTHNDLTEV